MSINVYAHFAQRNESERYLHMYLNNKCYTYIVYTNESRYKDAYMCRKI